MGLVNTGIPWFSIIDDLTFFGASAASTGAQNVTVGCRFSVTRALTFTGARFYWKSVGSAKTIRCKLWAAGVALQTVDVTVNASGVYSAVFTPAVLDPYRGYSISMRETTGTNYTFMDSTGTGPNGARPIVEMAQINAYAIGRSWIISAVGDAEPNVVNANLAFPIDPVFAPYNLIDGALI